MDNSWQYQELWIVTASSSDDSTQAGMKAATGINPYSTPTDKDKEIKDSRLKAGTLAVQMSQFVGVVSHLFSGDLQIINK